MVLNESKFKYRFFYFFLNSIGLYFTFNASLITAMQHLAAVFTFTRAKIIFKWGYGNEWVSKFGIILRSLFMQCRGRETLFSWNEKYYVMNLTCCLAIHIHSLWWRCPLNIWWKTADPDRFSLLHHNVGANNSTFDITELKFSRVYTS